MSKDHLYPINSQSFFDPNIATKNDFLLAEYIKEATMPSSTSNSSGQGSSEKTASSSSYNDCQSFKNIDNPLSFLGDNTELYE